MDPNDDLILNSLALMPPHLMSARVKNRPKRVFSPHRNLWLSQEPTVRFLDPIVAQEVDDMFDPPMHEAD